MTPDEILAERVYYLVGLPDEQLRITVRVGVPPRRSDGRFECAAELQEPDGMTTRLMNGEDAIEAMQLALVVLGVEMKHMLR